MADLALRILLQAQDLASNVVKNVGGSLQNLGGDAAGASSGLMMAATGAAAVAGAILSTIGPAADFQQAMIKSQAEAGLTQQQMTDMGNAILQMAPEVGQAPKDLADGLFFVESAGFAGKDALDTLRLSAQMAANDMTDTATVAKGLTTAVKAFGLATSDSAMVANQMTVTVSSGKMTMADYAQSIGKVALTAHGFNVSMGETNAALATLTNNGFPSAAQASTALQNVLQQFDGNTDKVAKNIKALGLSFDENKFKSMSLGDQIKYLSTVMKGHEDQLQKVLGGSKSAAQGVKALAGDTAGYQSILQKLNDAQKNGGAETQAFAATQQGFNFQMQQAQAAVQALQIKIGTALLPAMSSLLGAVKPVIGAFSNFVDWLDKTHLLVPVLGGVLAGCAALILATIVPAMWAWAAANIAATWEFLLIAAAIAGVVAAFIYFYNNTKPFKDFIDGMVSSVKSFAGVLGGDLKTVLGFIGNFLQSTFTPVWKQLQDTWNNQILPSVRQLIATFDQIKPQLTMLAQFVGGVLVVAFGLLVGALAGLVKGLAGLISGLIEAWGGVIQYISGLIQVISGIVSFIVDLLTGRFDKLKGDLGVIWGGIANMFQGFGNTIKGIFDGLVKGVEGQFSGFAEGITGYFNQILHGADDKTKQASIAAQLNTAQMKDKSVENAQAMNEQMQMKLIDMRNGIENQLKQTTDAAQKHTLQMKLNTVNNSLEMAQASGRNIVDMREKSLEQVDLLKQGVDVKTMSAADLAKYHALNMKDQYLGGVISMETQTIQKMDDMRQGIINELSKTTDAAKKKSLETQLAQVTHTEDTAKQVVKQHVQMRSNVEDEMDKLRQGASQKFGSIQKDVQNIVGNTGKWIEDRWNGASKSVTDTFGKMGKGIQDAVGNTGKWIQDKWHDATNKVVGDFNYLYKHSYLFQGIVDNIHGAFTAAYNFVTSTWKATSNWLVGAWNDTAKFSTDLWNKISKSVGDAWNTAVNYVKNVWKSISDIFSSAWNTYVAKPVSDFWNNVSKAFGNAWADHVSKPMSDLGTSISNTVSGWATSAWQWGVNVITGLANGISSATKGALHSALTGAADAVKSLIGWHSPTKEGPGSDSDKWAPNLVKMMSTGLESGIPQIQQAVNKLAKPIALTLNTGGLSTLGNVNLKASNSSSSSPLQGGGSSGVTVNNFNITITTQGGWSRNQVDDMYKQLKQRLDRDYRNSGNHITNTSGGRV